MPCKDVIYRVTCMLGKNPIGVKIVDETSYLKEGQEAFDVIDPKVRGFKHFTLNRNLTMLHGKRWGRKPLDFEYYHGFWLVSSLAKIIFERFTPEVFDFVEADLVFEDGSASQKVWLCDLTLILDALDAKTSDIKIIEIGPKIYNLSGSTNLRFFRKQINEFHIFRVKYAEYSVMCDWHFKAECKAANIKGISFTDTGIKVS